MTVRSDDLQCLGGNSGCLQDKLSEEPVSGVELLPGSQHELGEAGVVLVSLLGCRGGKAPCVPIFCVEPGAGDVKSASKILQDEVKQS